MAPIRASSIVSWRRRCTRKFVAARRSGIAYSPSKKPLRGPWRAHPVLCAVPIRKNALDCLLTHGYFLAEDPKEREIMKPYAPLGLLYLSSHLRARGFDVEIYDSTFGSREELFALIELERPPVVGVYGNLMTRAKVLAIARAAKSCGCRVVLGGPEPANYPGEYLD